MERSDKTEEASVEEIHEEEENDHINKHVAESNQKVTPTSRRSNRIRKPIVWFHDAAMVAIEEPLKN